MTILWALGAVLVGLLVCFTITWSKFCAQVRDLHLPRRDDEDKRDRR